MNWWDVFRKPFWWGKTREEEMNELRALQNRGAKRKKKKYYDKPNKHTKYYSRRRK